jgi:glyoxylase-like metal-dependent hydrolase (beta-lactamase superfamily II)
MNCEIEFMPVGTGAKPGDAIVVRYGSPALYELMVVAGGTLESGSELVTHLKNTFGAQVSLSHVVLTHPDADHASGLRTLLSEIPATRLWLHVPWAHAVVSKVYFAHKNWTNDGLAAALMKEYDLLAEIVDIATQRGISIVEPFVSSAIGGELEAAKERWWRWHRPPAFRQRQRGEHMGPLLPCGINQHGGLTEANAA